jgi:hypothetical protein
MVRAGIPEKVASVASILLNQGYSFEEIGELLCVTPEMLRKHYAHHDVSRKRTMLSSMKTTNIDHRSNIRKLDCRPNVDPARISECESPVIPNT